MKKLTIAIAVVLIAFSTNSYAQQTSNSETVCCERIVFPSNTVHNKGVKKGYYAISNNTQKLTRQSVPACCKEDQVVSNETTPAKGFYAVGDNSSKLSAQPVRISTGDPLKNVQKGYYSIGNKQQTKIQENR